MIYVSIWAVNSTASFCLTVAVHGVEKHFACLFIYIYILHWSYTPTRPGNSWAVTHTGAGSTGRLWDRAALGSCCWLLPAGLPHKGREVCTRSVYSASERGWLAVSHIAARGFGVPSTAETHFYHKCISARVWPHRFFFQHADPSRCCPKSPGNFTLSVAMLKHHWNQGATWGGRTVTQE